MNQDTIDQLKILFNIYQDAVENLAVVKVNISHVHPPGYIQLSWPEALNVIPANYWKYKMTLPRGEIQIQSEIDGYVFVCFLTENEYIDFVD